MEQTLPPAHPGVTLTEQFLEPMGISQSRLARDLSVPLTRINDIVNGRRAITADTALRLARYFRTSEEFWMRLQAQHDLELEKQRLGERLEREVSARPTL